MSYVDSLPTPDNERTITPCECRPDSEGSRHHCRLCRGSGALTVCKRCKRGYAYHNMYTPLICIACDPEAYANPPVGIGKAKDDDE